MATVENTIIINKFRDMVAKRYDYEKLTQQFTLPEQLSADVIEEIRNFFLQSIYPEPAKRSELEEAFSSLVSYMKNPVKIWGLLGNMTKAIFKFGRHFPKALKAGINTMDAYVGTKKFEADMARFAVEMKTSDPMTDEEFEQVMAALPRHEIEDFIKHIKVLFKSLTDTVLVEKTIAILDNIVETMRAKPEVYLAVDVNGILLGKNILEDGLTLFSQYDDKTKKLMVDYVYKNEMWFTDYVYDKWVKGKDNRDRFHEIKH